jgi:hypothetical protein
LKGGIEMAKELYENRKDNVNFSDSWLQNSVELALGGAVVAGAGAMAVRGDLSGSLRSGKNVAKAMGRGLDQYINRRSDPVARLLYRVGKGTYRGLGRLPKSTGTEGYDTLSRLVTDHLKEIEENPEIKERIAETAAKRFGDTAYKDLMRDIQNNTNRFENTDMKSRAKTVLNQVKQEELDKALGVTYKSNNTGKRRNKNNQEGGNKTPLFNKREMAQNFATAGVYGMGLGAGITGIHALDRAVANPDAQKNVETAFEIGSSWLKREDENEMKKAAASRDLYNSLKQIRRKTPEAMASGIGFTGISLGTAQLLKNQNTEKKNEEGTGGPRVIIELGNEQAEDVNANNVGVPPSLAGLPKLSFEGNNEFQKLARPSLFQNFKNFARDYKGYDNEIQQLKNVNYAGVAANELKDKDIPNLVKQKYGNLVNEKTEANFTGRLFDEQADLVKRRAYDQIDDYENRHANARLKGIAGATGLVGAGGLAALAVRNRSEENGGL